MVYKIPALDRTAVSNHRQRRAASAAGNEMAKPIPTATAVSSTCCRDAAAMSSRWRATQSHRTQGSSTTAAISTAAD